MSRNTHLQAAFCLLIIVLYVFPTSLGTAKLSSLPSSFPYLPSSFPSSILSLLPSSLPSSLPPCYTDNMQCTLSGGNLVSTQTDVETMELCRAKCLEVEDCNMFTHFEPSSYPFVNTCMTSLCFHILQFKYFETKTCQQSTYTFFYK